MAKWRSRRESYEAKEDRDAAQHKQGGLDVELLDSNFANFANGSLVFR